jgi:hypothetical protein
MSTSADELFQAFVSDTGNSKQHLVSLIKNAQEDKDYSLLRGKLMDYKRESDPEGVNWLPLLERCLNELRSIASDAIEGGPGNLSLTPTEVLVALVMLADTVIFMNETLATDRFCGTPAVTLPADDKDKLQNQVVDPAIDWFVLHIRNAIHAVDNVDDLKEFAMATRVTDWCCGHVDYHREGLERILQVIPADCIDTHFIAWLMPACSGVISADDIVSAACKTGDVFREVRIDDEQMEGCVTLSEQGDLSLVYGEFGENDQCLESIVGDLSMVESLLFCSPPDPEDANVSSLLTKIGTGAMPNLKTIKLWSVTEQSQLISWARALVRTGALDGAKLSQLIAEEGSLETIPEGALAEDEYTVVVPREALIKLGA